MFEGNLNYEPPALCTTLRDLQGQVSESQENERETDVNIDPTEILGSL